MSLQFPHLYAQGEGIQVDGDCVPPALGKYSVIGDYSGIAALRSQSNYCRTVFRWVNLDLVLLDLLALFVSIVVRIISFAECKQDWVSVVRRLSTFDWGQCWLYWFLFVCRLYLDLVHSKDSLWQIRDSEILFQLENWATVDQN